MIIVQLDSEQLSNLIQSSVRKVLKEIPPQTVELTAQPEQLLTKRVLELANNTIINETELQYYAKSKAI